MSTKPSARLKPFDSLKIYYYVYYNKQVDIYQIYSWQLNKYERFFLFDSVAFVETPIAIENLFNEPKKQ